ncbi:PEPxxWA-CTERM sorting domain-containing protein [Phenylobacterium sp.]|uniref:PEPxxWA-CTERM sorting domain-containing protein n=1 Tax=Phenylobacterium sp. TaxID=1871053 RepID=UPI0025F9CDF5|nr:PEPxxWA-CTERM sorting domain-containing protein [Phenylobacterium sp.]
MFLHKLTLSAVAAASALTLFAAPAVAADIIVPGANAGQSGGSNNFMPFDLADGVSQRYQQFYNSSAFGDAPVTLYGIKFRLATTGGTPGAPFDALIDNITINLSTAATDLAAASLTFAANVGADNTTVFDGPLHLTSTSPTKTSGVQPFDVLIQFENPFVYDPTKGDLLLDVFNFSGGETGLFDYITGGSDMLTRVVGRQGGVNDTTAFFQQRAGLVTAFATTPVPEPATWALMISGFGLAGAALRRRRERAA